MLCRSPSRRTTVCFTDIVTWDGQGAVLAKEGHDRLERTLGMEEISRQGVGMEMSNRHIYHSKSDSQEKSM